MSIKSLYIQKTDEEIKALAFDAFCGLIFFDFMIPAKDITVDLIKIIFHPLSLLDSEQLDLYSEQEISCAFEYCDKAIVNVYNGYPIFQSVQILNKNDLFKMLSCLEQYKNSVGKA